MFDEPSKSTEFLETYGGFLLHCGLSGIGGPQEDDKHAVHGELPNAPFDDIEIISGDDETGKYVEISGTYYHRVSFNAGYDFSTSYKIYETSSIFKNTIKIKNVRSAALPYLYLSHINFRPVDGSKLYDTAMHDKGSYIVHVAGTSEKLTSWIEKLNDDLTNQYNIGASDEECYDPEICITLKYVPDETGCAHTMQVLPDGFAHYVSHPVEALPVPVRWMARNGDEDALGIVLPATAEHRGRSNAEKKGQLKYIDPNSTVEFTLEAGLLEPECAEKVIEKIKQVRKEGK